MDKPAEITPENVAQLRELLRRGLAAHADLRLARERLEWLRREEDAAQSAVRAVERDMAAVYEALRSLNYHDVGHLKGALTDVPF
jgi:hypothetical protein